VALEHAILVSLSEQSATGYDLARRFDASIGFFWTASHQQIYRVLARMESDGWIRGKAQHQTGKPDKKTWSITPAGTAELTAWSSLPTPREALRSDFTVKLRGFADPAALARDTADRHGEHSRRLARYRASEQKNYGDPAALSGPELGQWLALRGGIHAEESALTWCEEILAALAGQGIIPEGRESR
jgi:DNA-binding PadR family transcriptional regulator